MKKYLVLFLVFLPAMSFGAPSVRMLGSQPALSAAINSGAKVTPVKSSGESSGVTTSARIGSLHTKPKSGALTSAGSVSSSSRFPVIQPAYSYNSVNAPQTSGGPAYAPANVDVAAIVDAVTQNIQDNYYDRNEVYNNNEFVTAVQEVMEDFENPRIDAVRVRTAAQGSPKLYWDNKGLSLPSDYIYIWVEEN